jgi:REP element-mobilizing transposase RayT
MDAQKVMVFRTWGGKRKGAGRKPSGKRAGVEHVTREVLKRRFPVHATWRMDGAWNLRSRRSFAVLRRAMFGGAVRFGFRLVHYAVMGNHVHLIVEAEDRTALWRGMLGWGVRIAKRMNRLMGRTGRVLVDRYHAHILKTPTEVRAARVYLLGNAQAHYGRKGPDPYASLAPVVAPRTWLLAHTRANL